MSEGSEYLKLISEKIERSYEELKKTIKDVDQDIRRMNDYYWQNYTEMDEYGYENYDNRQALLLSVDVNNENIKRAEKLKKMADSPFFGSFKFTFEGEEDADSFYIGIGNFSERKSELPLIYDWRAPVCSLYYDYDKGEASYEAPGGIIKGEINGKCQYKIRGGKMIYEVESDISIDDEILREELSKNGDVKLKNIIRTIQKEQNSIIRNRKDKNLVIQGCAGSGKTSIALHRIAYLLYHDRAHLSSSNVLIISPNGIFSDYIAHILPELGEEKIREMTFDIFAYRELRDYLDDCEDRSGYLERMIDLEEKSLEDADAGKEYKACQERYAYKQSRNFMDDCEEFVLEMEDELVDFQDISFRKYTMTAQRMEELFYEKFADIPMFTRVDYICDHFIDEYETLYGELIDKDELEIREKFDSLLAEKDIYALYSRFLKRNGFEELPDVRPEKRYILYEDVYPMLYMKYRLLKPSGHRQIRHLVIDEMQDYTYLQYEIINNLFACPKTILGDFAQTMEEKNRDVLKFLPHLLGKSTRTIKLTRSYRNTTQIAEYADRIWHNDNISFFERDGNEVREISVKDLCRNEDMPEDKTEIISGMTEREIEDIIPRLQTEKYETEAIITLTMEDAKKAALCLKEHKIPAALLDENSESFEKGLTVTPFYLAKGLEFDQVFVLAADDRLGIYKKYLYISATRALHELVVYKA